MKRIKKTRLNRLENPLAEVLGAERLARLTDIARLRRMWVEIVGPMLAQRSEPISIDSSCLWIAVDHSTMAQQIRFLQREIIEACFRKGGVRGVSRLRTRVHPGAGVGKEKQTPVAKAISWQQKKRIARELHGVENTKLKRAIFQARIAQLAFSPDGE
jgi:hypothetical protein